MLVRCGRCRSELEVAGSGEFACPQCGTRNVVRGTDLELPDLGATAAPPPTDAPGIRWIACPACAYRFALGEVEEAPCPSCAAMLRISDKGVTAVSDQASGSTHTT